MNFFNQHKTSAPQEQSAENVVESTPLFQEDIKFLSAIGLRLWRAQRQLHKTTLNAPSSELERLEHRFEEIIETLRDFEIEIIDHTNQKFDLGLNLRVLQYAPQEGITSDIIIETVKPSLRIKNTLIPGEVIVAEPLRISHN